MSWDVFIARYPAKCKRIDDLPEGWREPAMGTRKEVIAKITRVAPDTHVESPETALIDRKGFTAYVLVHRWKKEFVNPFLAKTIVPDPPPRDTDLIGMVSMSIHGGAGAPEFVAELLKTLDARATATGKAESEIYGSGDVKGLASCLGGQIEYRDFVMKTEGVTSAKGSKRSPKAAKAKRAARKPAKKKAKSKRKKWRL